LPNLQVFEQAIAKHRADVGEGKYNCFRSVIGCGMSREDISTAPTSFLPDVTSRL
jgi:hypothetical protein